MLRLPTKVNKLKSKIGIKRSPLDQQGSGLAPVQGLPGQDEQVGSGENILELSTIRNFLS